MSINVNYPGESKNIFEKISFYAQHLPNKIAYRYRGDRLTYKELAEKSDALAAFLMQKYPDRSPLAVFGHKSQEMLVCFFACVKSGHAYIPLDSSLPYERIKDVVINSQTHIILCADPDDHSNPAISSLVDFALTCGIDVYPCQRINDVISSFYGEKPDPSQAVKEDETYYIIYTSGSTGKPKGVQITLANLESFIRWGLEFSGITGSETFLNQAPFSFDLSVMDLYLSLASGSTLFAIDKSMVAHMSELFEQLKDSEISVWVSTPSFADMCLADPSFDRSLLPNLKTLLFCGETLTNKTVEGLLRSFPGSKVYNLYGPTEATVAVTQVLITEEMVKTIQPLPVGAVKSDCAVSIISEGKCLVDGEIGEIVITGASVSQGYYRNNEATQKAFGLVDLPHGQAYGYRTGDLGYLADNQLYYCGRKDFQVKLNGFRIEIEDIENNLRKLADVQNAVVIPSVKDGKVSHLCAFVILRNTEADKDLKAAITIKKQLREYLPEYMIPKKIIFKSSFPSTANGKIDRKLLMAEL